MMNERQIVEHVKALFDKTTTPGQAFDHLFALRQARVAYQEVFNAIVKAGSALDEEHVEREAVEFECPACGVSRTNRAFCINPDCSEHKPNALTRGIEASRAVDVEFIPRHERDPKFKNPIPSFGKYCPSKRFPKGLSLTEIAVQDPAYLKWMSEEHTEPFWREQAKMARVAAAATAPHWKDTESTGFFG